MDEHRFAVVTHSLTSVPSRRDVLRGLVGAGLGLCASRLPESAAGKNGRNKKLQRNAFGCVEVGGKCRGKDAACCSGRCDGKKPRKGQKDTSRCVAHGASTCQPGHHIQDVCGGAANVSCTTSTGDTGGACTTTTGNAAYCPREAHCRACKKDADCQPFCGKEAACIVCAGCPEGGTACASPTSGLCDFPTP
ncbi:MAG: hypothetical protein ACRDJC_07145 [Thermomicrobiales bacterium]